MCTPAFSVLSDFSIKEKLSCRTVDNIEQRVYTKKFGIKLKGSFKQLVTAVNDNTIVGLNDINFVERMLPEIIAARF